MCLFPNKAELNDFGRPTFTPEGSITLPCGTCTECLTKRTQEWALRCQHEMSQHKANCFITLTYNNEQLPDLQAFKEKIHFKKFIKRLRKTLGSKKIKYMASHEFGGKTFRPHHHLIIFGWSPANQTFLKNTPAGYPIFRSPHLEKIWDHGYSSTAEANTKTAYYVASYALKGKKHQYINDDGEITIVSDTMSASNGIGLAFATKNLQQLVDSETNIPRYYKKKLFEQNPQLHEQFDQRESARNPRIKTNHEKLAKFIITEQKNAQNENYLRNDTRSKLLNKHLEKQLKSDRDNYVATNKEK